MLNQILSLFITFSVIGWIIEVTYRSTKHKKPVNPGFFLGPYLPIYGFGGLILFIINSLSNNLLITIITSAILIIILELLTGILFIKYYKIKLWDYSERFLNYKGLICLEFATYWVILIAIFSYFVYPYLPFKLNNIFLFFIYFVFFLDVFHSLYSRLFQPKNDTKKR